MISIKGCYMKLCIICMLCFFLCSCKGATPLTDAQIAEVQKSCAASGQTLRVRNTYLDSVAYCVKNE